MFERMRATPILRLSLIAAIGLAVVRAVHLLVSPLSMSATFGLAIDGLAMPVSLAMCVGAFELASKLTGRSRKGALVAAYAYVFGLLGDLISDAVYTAFYASGTHATTGFLAISIMSFAVTTAATLGFAAAAWFGGTDRGHRVRVSVATAIALGAVAAFWILPHILEIDGMATAREYGLINTCISITRDLALIALVVLARPSSDTSPSIQLAARGLRMIAGSLWWRLAATLAGAFGMLRIAMAFGDDSARTYQLAVMAQASVEMVMLGVFALGAFVFVRAAQAGAPRRTFALAGIGAGWCAGVMSVKIPYLYMFTAGSISSIDAKLLESLTLGEPIVAIAAIAIVVFALRNVPGLTSLADSASARGLGFVIMMLVSVAIASVDLPREIGLGVVVFGALFGLAATVLVAQLLSRAARVLATEQPSLPTATALNVPEA